jgi:hypothetical protein
MAQGSKHLQGTQENDADDGELLPCGQRQLPDDGNRNRQNEDVHNHVGYCRPVEHRDSIITMCPKFRFAALVHPYGGDRVADEEGRKEERDSPDARQYQKDHRYHGKDLASEYATVKEDDRQLGKSQRWDRYQFGDKFDLQDLSAPCAPHHAVMQTYLLEKRNAVVHYWYTIRVERNMITKMSCEGA